MSCNPGHGDVQTQAFIKEEVAAYVPTAEDVDYPAKLERPIQTPPQGTTPTAAAAAAAAGSSNGGGGDGATAAHGNGDANGGAASEVRSPRASAHLGRRCQVAPRAAFRVRAWAAQRCAETPAALGDKTVMWRWRGRARACAGRRRQPAAGAGRAAAAAARPLLAAVPPAARHAAVPVQAVPGGGQQDVWGAGAGGRVGVYALSAAGAGGVCVRGYWGSKTFGGPAQEAVSACTLSVQQVRFGPTHPILSARQRGAGAVLL